MPTASTAALICDTGALLDYLVENAPDHRSFRNAIDKGRTRYIPALVLAEVDYFLRAERQAMQTFMQDVARGAFTYVPPTLGQLSRAIEIDRRYADLVLASWTVQLSRWPRFSASAVWRHVTCGVSRLSDWQTVARSTWSFFPQIPTDLDLRRKLGVCCICSRQLRARNVSAGCVRFPSKAEAGP